MLLRHSQINNSSNNRIGRAKPASSNECICLHCAIRLSDARWQYWCHFHVQQHSDVDRILMYTQSADCSLAVLFICRDEMHQSAEWIITVQLLYMTNVLGQYLYLKDDAICGIWKCQGLQDSACCLSDRRLSVWKSHHGANFVILIDLDSKVQKKLCGKWDIWTTRLTHKLGANTCSILNLANYLRLPSIFTVALNKTFGNSFKLQLSSQKMVNHYVSTYNPCFHCCI